MRLQLDTSVSQPGSTAPAVAPGSGAVTDRGTSSGGQDSVSISALTSTLSRLASDHAARLQQIAGSLSDGSYRVPAATIAGAIVGYSVASE